MVHYSPPKTTRARFTQEGSAGRSCLDLARGRSPRPWTPTPAPRTWHVRGCFRLVRPRIKNHSLVEIAVAPYMISIIVLIVIWQGLQYAPLIYNVALIFIISRRSIDKRGWSIIKRSAFSVRTKYTFHVHEYREYRYTPRFRMQLQPGTCPFPVLRFWGKITMPNSGITVRTYSRELPSTTRI